ncbi:uracil-DNA glycosylase family protein [Pediococcus ethanolidurans]|uniref:Uracil-DNA glycosylase-like domain-containing protein n=1 Tax=Pediococcus ethanolidurans TaxID=319653 RepID=A0A0R2K454_9LACO|nr:uracil-DNA glycosylase family protein [Pediococcus ethanolidurans]KRN82085.1 hypothetical protein IV87_GL000585 [Pediococcus ethanolidurans]GEN95615.1 DUF4918 domain-containing protein [Pediococcus ethanolidurans]SER76003.1 protein of unknown function [Pediococcus ethanolidurans]
MGDQMSFSREILNFNNELAAISIDLPDKFKIINPYSGDQKEAVLKTTSIFYQKYFNDFNSRRLILGSSPARRGTAVTGVPFEDAETLQNETGILIDNFHINQSASNFLNEVMNRYGGRKQFYGNFYPSFVCPFGLARINSKGNEVNCNYYENKKIQKLLFPYMISSIRKQLDFGIDTSICYCIGSGENYKVLTEINQNYHFFKTIIPLEHPRFITQYNSRNKDMYMEKYLKALNHD